MEPKPEHVLADLRATLDGVIRPALDDEFAREQAGLMSNLLEHLRLRILGEARLVRADSDDMRATLARLDLPAPLGDRLRAVPTGPGAEALSELRDENAALRLLLRDAIDSLEAPASERPGADGDLDAVRRLLRRQLDRERELLGPGYPAGT